MEKDDSTGEEITVEMTSIPSINPTNTFPTKTTSIPLPLLFHPPPTHGLILRQREFALICVSIVLGLAAACVAEVLRYLIAVITNIAFFGRFSTDFEANPSDNNLGAWVIPIPVIGGILAGMKRKGRGTVQRGDG